MFKTLYLFFNSGFHLQKHLRAFRDYFNIFISHRNRASVLLSARYI